MKCSDNTDIVKFSRAADLGNLEFLHATFISHSFPRHTHETFAIGVIERGVQATYYGGSTHIATPSDICLVNPGEVHTGFSPHESGWTYRVFYPDVSFLKRAADATCARGRLPHFPSPVIKDQLLSQNILAFLKLLEESDISLERESFLLSVLTHMIRRHADMGESTNTYLKKERRAVKTVLEYLDAHFTENVTLSELTDITNISEFHLLRLFRDEVGLPPHAYLIQKRINYAKNMLSQRLTIAQTALETGFADQSHFTRRFKKIMGITPGQYCHNSNIVQERN
ncbi:MAG: AraC family transcriptional regulator [Proteobacteria bacterium]|nr:AraC family transcriptional regulator [Pseudomonadota bacterium]